MDSCKSAKLVDSFYNSFYSEKNMYKKDQNLSNSLGDNLVYELKQLDSTLDDLFLTTNQQLNTHYSIHKFRLKVSRRISSFSSILKSLSRQCESLTNSQQRVKLFTLHQFYNDRLMKHKNRLSEWWSRNERRYHDLYLSSFVSHMKNSDKLKLEAYEASDFSDNGDAESDEGVITKKLKDTRNMMISQINQMDAAEPSLLKSSQYITQQVYILNLLKNKFTSVRITFSIVKRSAIKRYGVVRTCYFFFLGTCIFIFVRRIKILKLCTLLVKLVKFPFKYLKTKSQHVEF